jgi:hydroxymethylbilane synthase
MSKIIRIGTHDSQIAKWQSSAVQNMLEKLGHKTKIVPIKSTSDLVENKSIDIAMLNNDIDISIHSLKDVPTVLPEGIIQAAVIKRGNFKDLLIYKDNEEFLSQKDAIIATSSLRRRAQWLNRYPTHTIVDLNGDLDSRLQKLEDNKDWNAAIFNAADLGRLDLKPEDSVNLDWMIPTPAQGAIMIKTREDNEEIREICKELNNKETEICTSIEREFSNLLDEDSKSPIGALAFIKGEDEDEDKEVHFKGVLFSPDGSKKIEVTRVEKLKDYKTIAPYCADFIIERGGKNLMDIKKDSFQETNIYSTKTLTTDQRLLLNEKVIVESSDFVKMSLNRIKPQVVRTPIDNVIISSKNSVEALLHNFSAVELQFKNIYCIGRRTKRLVEKRIGPVKHTEKNAKTLAEYLVEYIDGNEVTYFCSDFGADDLSLILIDGGIKVNEVEAYQTKFDVEKIKDSVEGVMFYSPSTIQSYLKENDPDKIAFCIGDATAAEAKKRFEDIRVSKLPTVESIIELVNNHYV